MHGLEPLGRRKPLEAWKEGPAEGHSAPTGSALTGRSEKLETGWMMAPGL